MNKPTQGPVYDIHCHIGAPLRGEEMLAMMDRDGVDRAAIFVTPFRWTLPNPDNYYNTNDYIADMQAQHPDRFWGFCCMNPWLVGDKALGMPNLAVKELRRCIKDLGMRGIKLHTENHSFPFDGLSAKGGLHEFMDTLVALQEETGRKIPLLSHGMTTIGGQPDQFASVAEDYPQVNIVIAHGAGFQNLYFGGMERAIACPNLYFDTAMLTVDDSHLKGVVNQVGVERIIFGSDHFTRAHENLYGNFYHVLQRALPDPADLAKVLGGNLARLLEC